MTQTRATLDELEKLKNRAHNLNMYLDYVRQVDETLYNVMMYEFEGMPGYTAHADTYVRARDMGDVEEGR